MEWEWFSDGGRLRIDGCSRGFFRKNCLSSWECCRYVFIHLLGNCVRWSANVVERFYSGWKCWMALAGGVFHFP